MSALNKTREELLIELQELRKEHYAFKAVYENEITKRKQAEKDLREREEKFKALFESAKDGIFQLSHHGAIIAVNEAFARMHGYTVAEMMKKNIKDLDTPDTNRLTPERMQRILSGESITFEVEHFCKNGQTIPIEVSANLATIGNQKYILAFHRDITDRKRVEEEIKKSQMLLQSSIESQKDTILFSIDRDYRYLYFNKAHLYVMKYAYGKDIEIGMNILDCITSDDDRIAAKENYDRALMGESHTNIRTYGDINVDYYESYFNPVRDGNNKIIGATGLARNISERKKAEEKLWESEQRLSSIYNAVGAVIFHLAVEGEGKYRFMSINQAFSTVTGLSPKQVVGKMVNNVIPEPSLTMVLGKYKQAITGKRIIRWEETSDYPTGQLIGEVSIAPVIDEKGRCTHLVGSVLDITKRKKAEVELKKKSDELEALNSYFVGRELSMIELKKEVNELLKKCGEQEKYVIHS